MINQTVPNVHLLNKSSKFKQRGFVKLFLLSFYNFGYCMEKFDDWKINKFLVILYVIQVKNALNLVTISISTGDFALNLESHKYIFI
jgi:hypothetical protein